MSKQVNYNENLCSGAAIRDDKGRRISKLFEASHPKMTVGYAKNLIMPDTPTEQEFNFRQSGGGVIEDGVAVIDKVKGNSVVWNQLARALTGTNYSDNYFNNCTNTFVDNVVKSVMDVYIFGLQMNQASHAIASHRYLCLAEAKADSDLIVVSPNLMCPFSVSNNIGTDWNQYSRIVTDYSDFLGWFFVHTNSTSGGNVYIRKYRVIDLTQMFGAGNEPTTYEEFLSRKPKVADEYAYNEGTIVNNKVEKMVTTGRNLCPYLERGTLSIYNGSEVPSTTRVRTPFIPISNKHSYCTMLNKWSIRNGCFYDRNKNFISSGYPSTINGVLDSSAIPANAAFCRLIYSAQNGADVVTPSYDVFMFAVGNTTIPTTKYEPYEEHILDLAWVKDIKDAEGVKLFEDGTKSAGTAFDEATKGKAIKRIGVMDMGKITWHKREDISPSMFASYGVAPNNKIGLCPIASINKNQYDATLVDGILYWMGTYIMMYNSKFTTIDDFVNFVSGVPIYYELAEPIEVEYDEKNLTYPVVAGGTEEAIASETSTAFRADIGYGIDAVKTILDLKARVEALEGK